jgi:hypothetical protein
VADERSGPRRCAARGGLGLGGGNNSTLWLSLLRAAIAWVASKCYESSCLSLSSEPFGPVPSQGGSNAFQGDAEVRR